MVKAMIMTPNGPMCIIGLSDENVERIKEGDPVVFDNKIFGLPGKTIIMYGETEQAITDELSKHANMPRPKPGTEN